MADCWYSQYFKNRTVICRSPEEEWKKQTEQLRCLATSPLAQEIVERFEVPEVEQAEKQFKTALQEIADPEIRDRLDTAVGRISYAYQILGFCAGHFSQDSRARSF